MSSEPQVVPQPAFRSRSTTRSADLPSRASSPAPVTGGEDGRPFHLDVPRATQLLRRHADNPSAVLALNDATLRFAVPTIDGFVAYRPAGRRHLVQFGGPFCASREHAPLLAAFLDFARNQRRRVVAVQLMREDVPTYAQLGFTVDQVGADFVVDLSTFSLAGKHFMKLRNKVSRARRAGVQVRELDATARADSAQRERLAALDQRWLRGKGAHEKELSFLVGERGGEADPLRRLLVAECGGEVLGYLTLSPVFGRRPGWLHDLSRRRPDAPPGVAELLTLTAIERLTAEGIRWLHLGFTPLTGLDPTAGVPGASSAVARRTITLLAEHGERIYPAADQLVYKEKWAPSVVQPEYVAFSHGPRPGAVWALLRLTGAI